MILYRTAKWAEERKQLARHLTQQNVDHEGVQDEMAQFDMQMIKETESWKEGLNSPLM
ncbi:hypothetical protein [Marinicrinis sediminis]|uniref:Uncharacterized protein n=1 Tax=Marinicrinis sediminis TaxID=1652465 RepID=A0ABW5R7Z6_9BACL